MSYKRITEKRNGKNVIPLLNSVCGVDLPKWTIAEESDIRKYLSGDAVDKFAELEDKIENKSLIDLPCKIGEIAYFIIDNERVEPHEVVKISYKKNLCGKENWYMCYDEMAFGYNEFELGYRCFATETEAEAKLREINDGK